MPDTFVNGTAQGRSFAVLQGTFTAATQTSSAFVGGAPNRNISLEGPFTGTVVLERQMVVGGNWLPVTTLSGDAITWSAPMSTTLTEDEQGVDWRLRCTDLTVGTITYRMSQRYPYN